MTRVHDTIGIKIKRQMYHLRLRGYRPVRYRASIIMRENILSDVSIEKEMMPQESRGRREANLPGYACSPILIGWRLDCSL